MDGSDAFRAHFQMPAWERKKLKKEIADGKKTLKDVQESTDAEKFVNYKKEAEEFFVWFETTFERRVGREAMLGYLAYYYDEGFTNHEIKLHFLKKFSEEYFKENPEKFTIPNVLPIKDQDRINFAWDALAYYQGLKERKFDEAGQIKIKLPCGHESTVAHERLFNACHHAPLLIFPYTQRRPSLLAVNGGANES